MKRQNLSPAVLGSIFFLTVALVACVADQGSKALARDVTRVTVEYDDGTTEVLTRPAPATQPTPEPEPTTQPTDPVPSDGPLVRRAFEGFPVFFDSTDGGLEPTEWTTFQVQGGSLRRGYRPGYAFAKGDHVVTVGAVTYNVLVAPYAPRKVVTVTPEADSQGHVEELLAADVELVWAAGAETVITRDLVIPAEAFNLKVTGAKLQVAPPAGKSAAVVVKAVGFRADAPDVRIDPARTDTKPWGRPFDVTAFIVADGGQAVIRRARASGINTFVRTEAGNRGCVVEDAVLTDLRCYALYSNGGTAGVSWRGGTVRGHGYEPFFRVIDHPGDGTFAANYYVGDVEMWRLSTDRPVFKDGVTFRSCARASSDENTLHRCQHRSGQDDQGVADGGADPYDILTYGGLVESAYYDHKKGLGKSKRIHVIGVRFTTPFTQPPIMFSGVTDGTIEGNTWAGGPATWAPKGSGNVRLVAKGNSN